MALSPDLPPIAVLCGRRDSHYKGIPVCDVFDYERHAMTKTDSRPMIAHPPCRSWGRLRASAKPRPEERTVARWCVARIRQHGGVLEHPSSSTLWLDQEMARPGEGLDEYGGYTLDVKQFWWGHRAEKRTWLYVVGLPEGDLPVLPRGPFGRPSHVVAGTKGLRKGMANWRPECSKSERERTPPAFAEFLVAIALRIYHARQ